MSRVLHFGVGNFHRAHQAWYTQRADDGWRITGVSLRGAGVRDLLRPQGFDYTLLTRDAGGSRMERIEVLDDVLVAPEDPGAVLALMASPEIAVVTITVTEKGYCLAPKTGALDPTHPDIARDLRGGAPRSLVGYLARGLARRRDAGAGPMTIVSCDNLADNGATLARAVRAFAEAAGLGDDLLREVRFPGTMVDRITPDPGSGLAASIAPEIGWNDRAPVETETFSEWVIEDDFAGPRPAWERAGALLTGDVVPYERRKLRLLNGAHSLLAHRGIARGHACVHQAIADPVLRRAALDLMDAAARTLPGADPGETEAYRDRLIRRFENPALEHRLAQIAMDGSKKVPPRHLDVAEALLARGEDAGPLALAVGAWVAFVADHAERGAALDDPASDALRAAAAGGGGWREVVRRVLACADGRPWPDAFVDAIAEAVDATAAERRGVDG